MRKPEVVALCDEPRVFCALATQTKNWVDLYEAADLDAVSRVLENHPDAVIVFTQLLLGRPDGADVLRTLRDRHPANRRCLLASSFNLARIVEAIHEGLVDALIHVPLTYDNFMAAVAGPPLVGALVADCANAGDAGVRG